MNTDNKHRVIDKLNEIDLSVTSMTKTHKWHFLKRPKKVKSSDLALFCEQFAAMLDAGFSIDRALDTLEKQMENETLKQIIKEIKVNIERGVSLSNSLNKYNHIFSDLFINMISAGETGGVLNDVLLKLASYLEREEELKRKIKSAFSYPIVVSVLLFFAVTFILVFIIPRFTMVYKKLGINLPLVTMILVWSSHIVRKFWWAILAGLSALAFGFQRFRASESGSLILDRFKIRMPIFGKLISMTAVSQFLSAFSTLVNSGISTMQSLDVAGRIPENKVIRSIVRRVRKSVYSGGKISDPMLSDELFPPVVVQMIASGEETGALADMLNRAAKILDRNVDITVKKIIVVMEPALTVFLAAVVGFIAIAIYLPMFDLITTVNK